MAKNVGKKFIGVHFECCGLYTRIYYNEKENAYKGNCPLCRRPVNVKVDPQTGVEARFFKAKGGGYNV